MTQRFYKPILHIALDKLCISGPPITALTFKGTEWVKDTGTASGDGLIMLCCEETLRRRHKTLESYIVDTKRHELLSDENRADEGFYV